MDAKETAELLSIKDAAKNLGVSLGAVYALCKKGALAHYRLGIGRGRILISWSDLTAFLQGCHRSAVNAVIKTPLVTDQKPATGGATIRPLKHIKYRQPPAEPPA